MSRYAIIENGKVKNIVKADAETASANGWVEAVGEFATIHQEPSPPPEKTQTELLIDALVKNNTLSAKDAESIKKAKR